MQSVVILDIFHDQVVASPGSCNSSAGLKQLFGDEIKILVPGASDMKQKYATVCASTQKYENKLNIVQKRRQSMLKFSET